MLLYQSPFLGMLAHKMVGVVLCLLEAIDGSGSWLTMSPGSDFHSSASSLRSECTVRDRLLTHKHFQLFLFINVDNFLVFAPPPSFSGI